MQGSSIRPLLEGSTPDDWQDAVYYRYWMHQAHHNVAAHYGIRTKTHKLIYYYADPLDQPGTESVARTGSSSSAPVLDLEPEWELFDLEKDPLEMNNVYRRPEYASVAKELTAKLHEMQARVGDSRHWSDQ